MAGDVYGTSGPDTIYQSDYGYELNIWGYGGNDRIYLNVGGVNGGFNWVSAGTGNDRVRNVFEGGNEIYLGSGNDTYIGTGWSNAPAYWDEVLGGDGDDTFDVTTNQSDYYGENGNDYFFSVGFNNYFNGGSGNDTISYETQDADPDLYALGVYIDLGRGFAQTFETDFQEELRGIENAIGTGVADDIYGSGVNNTLWGDAGADIVSGLAGNDVLYGGTGWDDLYGGSSRDKLIGGRGYDLQWGGTGADTFIFESINDSVVGSNRDVVEDFSRSQGDLIDLRPIDADATSSGNQSFFFIGTASFSDTAGELRFSNGILAGDTTGDGAADFQVAVNGWNKLTASDFLL
ncbi:calcium-binding protein [Rhizobiaceae bacterium n13]|uniref:Calcium-binding protein n=1 Tax=Ferirhizobium litorale TaxID=2927786 RepID=A0AAE3TZT0_9HYPH|nr:calcium-binding protein [Fererhizobium litorale]MDI7861192.1 calcium-binding protein [Fererhizobium litorale]MDI7921339.1 calcium-binding protein [Fererhizobium litorale]